MSFTIKDTQGHCLGRLVESPNGWTYIERMNGNRLGYYNPVNNQTFTIQGRFVAFGNVLSSLLLN